VWESPAAAKIFCCARNAESSDKTRAGAAILSSEPAADAARANRAGVERGNGGAPTAAISWNRGNPVREVGFWVGPDIASQGSQMLRSDTIMRGRP